MASIVETYTVITKGIGAPDYSDTVSSARERRGIQLKYSQRIKLFDISFSPSVDIATVLVGAHSSGETVLTLADATGFWVNGSLVVAPGVVNQEIHKITNIVGNAVTIATGLDNNQAGGTAVIIFSPYPWVVSPLAPGALAHLIDQETGIELPYTIPQGYVLTLVTRRWLLSQDNRFEVLFDGRLVMGGDSEGGVLFYLEEVLPFSTALLDPTAGSAHTLDIFHTNLGEENLCGGITGLFILEAIGTAPLPTTKTTKCPFCGNKQVESVHATRIKCSNCGKEYLVYDLTGFRETV